MTSGMNLIGAVLRKGIGKKTRIKAPIQSFDRLLQPTRVQLHVELWSPIPAQIRRIADLAHMALVCRSLLEAQRFLQRSVSISDVHIGFLHRTISSPSHPSMLPSFCDLSSSAPRTWTEVFALSALAEVLSKLSQLTTSRYAADPFRPMIIRTVTTGASWPSAPRSSESAASRPFFRCRLRPSYPPMRTSKYCRWTEGTLTA
ncbi:hypothetical protein OH77DRAFT_1077502 [Trametes cingulata]|nr:hypothetical protein OH77DRAFT_1077502 [Trametes cingulata]